MLDLGCSDGYIDDGRLLLDLAAVVRRVQRQKPGLGAEQPATD